MTQKNLELQQQALMLIMKQYGNIPDIMQPSAEQQAASGKATNTGQAAAASKGESLLTVWCYFWCLVLLLVCGVTSGV